MSKDADQKGAEACLYGTLSTFLVEDADHKLCSRSQQEKVLGQALKAELLNSIIQGPKGAPQVLAVWEMASAANGISDQYSDNWPIVTSC